MCANTRVIMKSGAFKEGIDFDRRTVVSHNCEPRLKELMKAQTGLDAIRSFSNPSLQIYTNKLN